MAIWTLDSTNLKGIEYRKGLDILVIYFKQKAAIWEYSSVPESVYLAFRDAPSPGKFYAAEVKGKFVGRKIDDPTDQ